MSERRDARVSREWSAREIRVLFASCNVFVVFYLIQTEYLYATRIGLRDMGQTN